MQGQPDAARGAACALASLAVLAASAGGAFADPSANILGAEYAAVDVNGNGLADYLNITLTLSPPQAGSYLVSATLRWPATGTSVAAASSIASLPSGVAQLTLRIDGATVSEKQLDGPYNLSVELVSSPSGPVRDRAWFATPAYRAADFERAALEDKPRLHVGEQSVQLSSPAINASVNLTRPAVRWGPASSEGGASFEATFPRVVAFLDDGDHAFEEAELACEADLEAATWSIAALEVGPSAELGSTIRFSIQADVVFAGALCAPPVEGTLALRFLITQRSGTVEGPTPVAILGGLEVKVDLVLQLAAPLPASDIAFEVNLRGLAPGLDFLVRGGRGYTQIAEGEGPLPVEPLVPVPPADVERVSFVDQKGAAVGHFACLSLAAENLSGGQERFAQVTASRGLSNGTLRVFLAAPNDPALEGLTLDPVVGVTLGAAPPSGGVPPPPPPPARPSLIVFVAAVAAASAMFFFSVYARAKKY